MDVNIGSKITRKRRELRDWDIENTFGVVYVSVEWCVILVRLVNTVTRR